MSIDLHADSLREFLESQAHISTHVRSIPTARSEMPTPGRPSSSGKRPDSRSRAADTPLLTGCWVVLGRPRERTGKALMVGVPPLKVVSQVRSQVLIHDSHVLLVE